MNLGLLPALGGSLTELRRTGQDSRLIDGYLRRYVEAFENVSYFSYAPEALGAFTDEPRLLERVMLFPPSTPQPRASRVGYPAADAAAVRACAVLRVFQITGGSPRPIQRRFGVPVTSYGFWYGQLSRPGPRRVLKASSSGSTPRRGRHRTDRGVAGARLPVGKARCADPERRDTGGLPAAPARRPE
jgi:hypothetical protein